MLVENIVLDLDECILHTYGNQHWDVYDTIMKDPKHFSLRQRIFKIKCEEEYYWGLKRPHLEDFLAYCFSTFSNVCVWSAGTKKYVKAIVLEIFKDYPYPSLVMTRDNVFWTDRYNYSKPLIFLYNRLGEANSTNTIMIDDKEDNFVYNPDNGITIPPYDPEISLEEEDDIYLLMLVRLLSSHLT